MRQKAKQKGADLERQRFEGILLDEVKTEKQHLREERLQQIATAAKLNLENWAPENPILRKYSSRQP